MRTAVHRPAVAKAVLALAILAVAGQVRAESNESKWRKACWGDAFSFCTLQSLSNNRNGVRDCLVHNIDKISPACRRVIREAHDHGITAAEAPQTTATPANTSSQ